MRHLRIGRGVAALSGGLLAFSVVGLSAASAKPSSAHAHSTTTTTTPDPDADPSDTCLDINDGNAVYGRTAHEFHAFVHLGASGSPLSGPTHSCTGYEYVFVISSADGTSLGWATNPAMTSALPSSQETSPDGAIVTITFTGSGPTAQYEVDGFTWPLYESPQVRLQVLTFAPGASSYGDRAPNGGGTYAVGPNGLCGGCEIPMG